MPPSEAHVQLLCEQYLQGKTTYDLAKEFGPNRNIISAILRANGIPIKRRPFCINGHEFTSENTLVTSQGWRRCRKCNIDKCRRWQARHPEKYRAYARISRQRADPGKKRERRANWEEANKGRVSAARIKYRASPKMHAARIKYKIAKAMGIASADVPKSLVDAKIAHIRLRNALRKH